MFGKALPIHPALALFGAVPLALAERVEAARAGLRVIEALPCDVLLTPHPGGSEQLVQRLAREARPK